MAQNETLEQLIERFIARLLRLKESGESLDLDRAIYWATGILDAYKAEHGNDGDHDEPYRRG